MSDEMLKQLSLKLLVDLLRKLTKLKKQNLDRVKKVVVQI